MAFTCKVCGFRNSDIKAGGAVPTYGTQVRNHDKNSPISTSMWALGEIDRIIMYFLCRFL